MSVNRIALGKRISFYRLKFSMTQEKLADLTNCSREYIAYLENGVKTPSLPILVDLANALHISVDALLVDSLDYSLSSSDSDLHRLLLDCNETEQEIIIRTAREDSIYYVLLRFHLAFWIFFVNIRLPPHILNYIQNQQMEFETPLFSLSPPRIFLSNSTIIELIFLLPQS